MTSSASQRIEQEIDREAKSIGSSDVLRNFEKLYRLGAQKILCFRLAMTERVLFHLNRLHAVLGSNPVYTFTEYTGSLFKELSELVFGNVIVASDFNYTSTLTKLMTENSSFYDAVKEMRGLVDDFFTKWNIKEKDLPTKDPMTKLILISLLNEIGLLGAFQVNEGKMSLGFDFKNWKGLLESSSRSNIANFNLGDKIGRRVQSKGYFTPEYTSMLDNQASFFLALGKPNSSKYKGLLTMSLLEYQNIFQSLWTSLIEKTNILPTLKARGALVSGAVAARLVGFKGVDDALRVPPSDLKDRIVKHKGFFDGILELREMMAGLTRYFCDNHSGFIFGFEKVWDDISGKYESESTEHLLESKFLENIMKQANLFGHRSTASNTDILTEMFRGEPHDISGLYLAHNQLPPSIFSFGIVFGFKGGLLIEKRHLEEIVYSFCEKIYDKLLGQHGFSAGRAVKNSLQSQMFMYLKISLLDVPFSSSSFSSGVSSWSTISSAPSIGFHPILDLAKVDIRKITDEDKVLTSLLKSMKGLGKQGLFSFVSKGDPDAQAELKQLLNQMEVLILSQLMTPNPGIPSFEMKGVGSGGFVEEGYEEIRAEDISSSSSSSYLSLGEEESQQESLGGYVKQWTDDMRVFYYFVNKWLPASLFQIPLAFIYDQGDTIDQIHKIGFQLAHDFELLRPLSKNPGFRFQEVSANWIIVSPLVKRLANRFFLRSLTDETYKYMIGKSESGYEFGLLVKGLHQKRIPRDPRSTVARYEVPPRKLLPSILIIPPVKKEEEDQAVIVTPPERVPFCRVITTFTKEIPSYALAIFAFFFLETKKVDIAKRLGMPDQSKKQLIAMVLDEISFTRSGHYKKMLPGVYKKLEENPFWSLFYDQFEREFAMKYSSEKISYTSHESISNVDLNQSPFYYLVMKSKFDEVFDTQITINNCRMWQSTILEYILKKYSSKGKVDTNLSKNVIRDFQASGQIEIEDVARDWADIVLKHLVGEKGGEYNYVIVSRMFTDLKLESRKQYILGLMWSYYSTQGSKLEETFATSKPDITQKLVDEIRGFFVNAAKTYNAQGDTIYGLRMKGVKGVRETTSFLNFFESDGSKRHLYDLFCRYAGEFGFVSNEEICGVWALDFLNQKIIGQLDFPKEYDMVREYISSFFRGKYDVLRDNLVDRGIPENLFKALHIDSELNDVIEQFDKVYWTQVVLKDLGNIHEELQNVGLHTIDISPAVFDLVTGNCSTSAYYSECLYHFCHLIKTGNVTKFFLESTKGDFDLTLSHFVTSIGYYRHLLALLKESQVEFKRSLLSMETNSLMRPTFGVFVSKLKESSENVSPMLRKTPIFVDYGFLSEKDKEKVHNIEIGGLNILLKFPEEVVFRFVGVIGHHIYRKESASFEPESNYIRLYVFMVFQIERTHHQMVVGPIVGSKSKKFVVDVSSDGVYPLIEMTQYDINSRKSLTTGKAKSLFVLSDSFVNFFTGVLRNRIDVVLPFLFLVRSMIKDGGYKPVSDGTIEGFGGKKLDNGFKKGDLLLTLIHRQGKIYEVGIVHIASESSFNSLGLETGFRQFGKKYDGEYGWEEGAKSLFPIAPIFFKLEGFDDLEHIPMRFDLSIFKWVNHFMVFPVSQILRTQGAWCGMNIDSEERPKLENQKIKLPEIHASKCVFSNSDYCLPYMNDEEIRASVLSALRHSIVIYGDEKWIPKMTQMKKEGGEVKIEKAPPSIVSVNGNDSFFFNRSSDVLEVLDILMGDQPMLCGSKYSRTLPDAARDHELIIDSFLNAFHANCLCIRLHKVLGQGGDSDKFSSLNRMIEEMPNLGMELKMVLEKTSISQMEYSNITGRKKEEIEENLHRALQEFKTMK